MWKAKYYDECDEQGERNRNNNISINPGMLQGVGQYGDAFVQMKGSAHHSTKYTFVDPLATLNQKVSEPWPEFLACIKRTVITIESNL
jgi:hypothetical protein